MVKPYGLYNSININIMVKICIS